MEASSTPQLANLAMQIREIARFPPYSRLPIVQAPHCRHSLRTNQAAKAISEDRVPAKWHFHTKQPLHCHATRCQASNPHHASPQHACMPSHMHHTDACTPPHTSLHALYCTPRCMFPTVKPTNTCHDACIVHINGCTAPRTPMHASHNADACTQLHTLHDRTIFQATHGMQRAPHRTPKN
jgi:hypothetical protein